MVGPSAREAEPPRLRRTTAALLRVHSSAADRPLHAPAIASFGQESASVDGRALVAPYAGGSIGGCRPRSCLQRPHGHPRLTFSCGATGARPRKVAARARPHRTLGRGHLRTRLPLLLRRVRTPLSFLTARLDRFTSVRRRGGLGLLCAPALEKFSRHGWNPCRGR